uniref:ER-bound oxygenase mpaB/mpaB'/Rubber oxygenase catalytic domain-containing protein n=1 Tax=Anopheles atroparvus TaxID=41427 RepID=A0A182IL11_ANOAO
MTVELELTNEEKVAKEYFLNMFTALHKPCDVGTGANLETRLPPWFDAVKFKRGQQFYSDNRFGILQASFCSLLMLMADPKGLHILEHTGKSSTTEAARKRYVSTLVHMTDWYESELAPGSKSWKSLSLVRRMHLSASNSASNRNIGFINQMEMALTSFGFMGFPLIRPHLLGIRYDNREDREAFVHLWAVLGFMLGIEDQYNICLHRLEVFKRGQQFYSENRSGIQQASFCSLLVLLADPKGLRISEHTGMSGTTEAARRRYASTLVHMTDWYESELAPGSRSWKSLSRVRRMHLSVSNSASKRNLGFINQSEIALTSFGFMGFPLVRPHLLGIRYDNREDREAFVHLWAVLGFMLGVEDQYNMCLYRLEVVEVICQMLLRYIFLPSLQLETPLFRQMVITIVDAFADYMPFTSYESVMFLTRRLVGVPGYQYMVDMEKEQICRRLLSMQELDGVLQYMETRDGYRQAIEIDKVRLYHVKDLNSPSLNAINQNFLTSIESIGGPYTEKSNNELSIEELRQNSSKKHLRELLGLKQNQELVVTLIENDSEWSTYLNDDKLKQLSERDQMYVKITIQSLNWCYSTIGRFVNEWALSFILYRIKQLRGK